MASQQTPIFSCRDIHVFVEEREVVKGVDLTINPGEKHALMGPNGSGKSSLAAALMGHPAYRLEGEIFVNGEAMTSLSPEERARHGMFLGFQHPVAVPGVSVANMLRAAVQSMRGEEIGVREFRRELYDAFDALGIGHYFAGRYLNDGFLGGEKKRLEVLQMVLLRPRFSLLDEIDSGLDIDALKVVAKGIERAVDETSGLLLVTHYQRILNYVRPDRVHVLVDGRITRSGGPEQALELEERGYAAMQLAAPPRSGGLDGFGTIPR